MLSCLWAHVCDYAFFDNANKPCLIGIFTTLFASRVPTQHTRCAYAFEIAGEPFRKVRFQVLMVRPDGKDPLMDLSSPELDLGPAGRHTAIIGIDNITIPDFGPYELRVYLNDNLAHTTVVNVVRRREQPAN